MRKRSRRRALERRAAKRLPKTVRCPTSGVLAGLPAYGFIGRIPTAAYPDDVQTTPQGKLIWIAGKGFGSGPNPSYYFGGARTQFQTPPNAYGTYVLDLLIGRVGTLDVPTDLQVVADTAQANAQAAPSNAETAPAGSPIPAVTGQPSSQIKHVFYIVRENRTYDQVFGSDPRGDGNPGLELFDDNGVSGPTGGVTPNAHALSRQFPLLDHFYEDSEVSVDGHLITAGGTAIDYAQKATAANYANRRGTYDFGIFPVSFPPKFFLFDQAAKQGISFRDYGEAVGSLASGSAPNRPQFSAVEQNVDSAYPNNVFLGCLQANNPAACTQDSGLYNGTGTIFAGQSRLTPGTRSSSPRSRPARARLELHDPAQRSHQRHDPGRPDPAGADRRQRPGPGPDRRRDLAFLDLALHGDLRRRGRLAGRCRPRRRAPGAGLRDQPLGAPRGGRPDAL